MTAFEVGGKNATLFMSLDYSERQMKVDTGKEYRIFKLVVDVGQACEGEWQNEKLILNLNRTAELELAEKAKSSVSVGVAATAR